MKELRQKKSNRNICRWMTVCAVCMLFWAAGISTWAARTGNVRVNDVNVRSEASAESNRVCKLPVNTTVNVVDQAEGSDGKLWYSVTFTLDGSDKAGWIRSDMLTVSEDESPEEGTEGEGSSAGQVGSYTIQEPEEAYAASDALTQSSVTAGEESCTAWQVDTGLTGGRELYLVYASKADGESGWYYYDPEEGTFQRDMGQFSGSSDEEPEGLIQALQKELTDLKESSAKQLSMRLYIIIGLAVLCVILLILVIVFGVKYRNAAYEYYDDEEDDSEEPDDGEYEEEDDEDDDFDDFYAAVRKKQEEGKHEASTFAGHEEDIDEEPEEELAEDTDAEEEEALPEIDMSAVVEIEEEAKHVQQEGKNKGQNGKEDSGTDEDGLDDFDIEILDWEDLGL